jgi:chemotaxis protein CheD
MFKAFTATQIGARNLEEVERLLNALGISIIGKDVGGNRGRSVEFDMSTGTVKVLTVSSTTLEALKLT